MGFTPVRARPIIKLELNGDGNGWTTVTGDVFDVPGIHIERGHRGNSIKERVAPAGTASLSFINAGRGGIENRYNPDHPSCRLGFREGIGIWIELAGSMGIETVFRGRVDDIAPSIGNRGRAAIETKVTCVDWMEEAANTEVTGLATQTNKRADELLTTLLTVDGLRQPVGTSFDTGRDTFGFAFDGLSKGKGTVRAEIGRIVESGGLEYAHVLRDGTFRYENRGYRVDNNQYPAFTFDNTMFTMRPLRTASRVINRMEVTVHPRLADTDFSVLWSMEDRPLLNPGETRKFKGQYKDSDIPGKFVGAVEVQTTLVAGQDYIASIQQALASGTPDTPITLYPTAVGFYTGGSTGSISNLGDGNDSTGMTPVGAIAKHSVTLTQITAASNAAVSGVRFKVRIDHSPQGAGGFFVFYPQVRLNGIDLDIKTAGGSNHASAYQAGITQEFFEVPLPPGGSTWNVGAANDVEFVWYWNWGGDLSALPALVHVEATLLYAAAVEELDRTADFTATAIDGGKEAEFEVTNNGTEGAYLVRLQIRGKRLTANEPVELIALDEDSIDDNGKRDESFSCHYLGDSAVGQGVADYVVSQWKDPFTHLDVVSIMGNRSDVLMRAAMTVDVSTLIAIKERRSGIDRKYFVNGVSLDIRRNGVVYASWVLTPADPQNYFTIGESEIGGDDAIAPY